MTRRLLVFIALAVVAAGALLFVRSNSGGETAAPQAPSPDTRETTSTTTLPPRTDEDLEWLADPANVDAYCAAIETAKTETDYSDPLGDTGMAARARSIASVAPPSDQERWELQAQLAELIHGDLDPDNPDHHRLDDEASAAVRVLIEHVDEDCGTMLP